MSEKPFRFNFALRACPEQFSTVDVAFYDLRHPDIILDCTKITTIDNDILREEIQKFKAELEAVIEQMDLHTRELYAEAMLGDDAAEFFQSEIGRYVLERAREQTEDASAKLQDVDPTDAKTIRDLQNDIYRAGQAIKWLNEMIIAGKEAMKQLEVSEDEIETFE